MELFPFDERELRKTVAAHLRYRCAQVGDGYDWHDFARIEQQARPIAARIKRAHPNIAALDHDSRVHIVVEAIRNEPMLLPTPAPRHAYSFTESLNGYHDRQLNDLKRFYRRRG